MIEEVDDGTAGAVASFGLLFNRGRADCDLTKASGAAGEGLPQAIEQRRTTRMPSALLDHTYARGGW